ncbi:hypothetical protein [Rhodococcus marinonascens]|uniref:hypothetical protein n=1 Tax=Rhodococcus marinonascens TaxID=38311 RepID=UPI000934AB9B|nr:hypothetical protein [Rhodococcus marinonascens]
MDLVTTSFRINTESSDTLGAMRILKTVFIATSAIAATTVLGPTAYAAPPMGSSAARVPSNADVTLSVGSDIKPGTYTSAGAATDGTACFWSVTDQNGAPRDGGQTDQTNDRQTVTLEADDTFFQTTHCAAWNGSGQSLFGSLS